jgi:hypothetical protein
MDVDPQHISEESSPTNAKELRKGFLAQKADPNQQMEDMIGDLHRPARRQGSGR